MRVNNTKKIDYSHQFEYKVENVSFLDSKVFTSLLIETINESE